MFNPKIFVLYSKKRSPLDNEPFELYTILCEKSEHAVGYEIYDPDKPYIHKKGPERKECGEKLKALRENIFKKENDVKREFHLRQDGKDIPGAVIHDNTQSVFLGLYLTLYQEIENKEFNADWTSITVTGDIKIEGENIRPDKVKEDVIPQKFADYKEYIQNYSVNNSRHLFVYVSDNPLDEVKNEGNITVRHFSPHDTIESVRNCVFEKQYEELQKFLYEDMQKERMKRKTNNIKYIKNETYRNIENEILKNRSKGYFIWGEGESGKSEMAETLTHFLMEREKIYAPIWVHVDTTAVKRKKNENEYITLEGATIEYITNEIGEKVKEKKIEISDLTEFLEKRRYLLIIDNLEFDNVDLNEVVQGINSIIMPMRQNLPYLIITSCNYTASVDNEMGFEQMQSLELSKNNIKEFFDIIIESDILLAKFKQKDEYTEFIDALYEHYRSYPGLIIPAINSIKSGKTIESLLSELKSIRTEGVDEKAIIIFRAVFSMLDESSQVVLFTLLDKISPDTTIGQDKLIEAVKEKAAVSGLLTPGMAEKALDNLVNKALIYREASVEDELPRYGMKGVPFLAFMFGDIFAGQADAEEKKNLRESLVRNTWRLHMALRYKRSAEIIDELENDIADTLDLGDIYYQESMFSNPDKYITKSVKYYKKSFAVEARYVFPSRERYIKAFLQYLKARNRASWIKGTIDKFDSFLFYHMNEFNDTLINDPEYHRECGDVFCGFGCYSFRYEDSFDVANQAYKKALALYSPETDIKAIRATKIKQAINLGEWSDVTNERKAKLEWAKDILMDRKYFHKLDPLEYADKNMALANIYLKLSNHHEDKTYKRKSIASYINARNIYDKEKDRIKNGFAWAELSVAYMACNPSVEDINKSIDACKEALKVFHKNDFPVYYAEVMNHLGNAYKAFVKERGEEYFEGNLCTFRKAEEIFQESEMLRFMTGRVKHNIGDLYYKYALNPSHGNNRRAKLLHESIKIFQEANRFLKEDARCHISNLLFQGRTCLGLAEILPDDDIEKVRRLKEAIEALEAGIKIYTKHSIEARYDYKWLFYNNALAHERLYKFTQDSKDINRALLDVMLAMEFANPKERERMEADCDRMYNVRDNMDTCP